ncbi:MAG: NAD-dependent protein deacylase [Rikenellaceae bacterium]|nr:NAD-dependent protein deacylase [Rikenellaceae bacterium]
MQTKYKHLNVWRRRSDKHIVFFTGAGISAESGMPIYRGDNGIYNNESSQLSVGKFYEDPQTVLVLVNEYRYACLEAEPNHAHRMIAELEKWADVSVITQNVDNLHERAGSTNVIHLHGELTKVTSSDNRLSLDCIQTYPLGKPIKWGDKAADGSQLRPYITMFGEFLTEQDKVAGVIKSADIFVIIGTSLQVFPASTLIRKARTDIPRYIIDPNTELDGYTIIKDVATKGIDKLIDCLQNDITNSKPIFTATI